ncbi:Ribosomal RNA adenine methylase transferase [mine drainage metagenome]|uniref:Ribosomal RNA adenine methylase transferase n=1 Tax=mine drainage metagenome TaxID=410659 RepID=T1AJK5_9ZZZZ
MSGAARPKKHIGQHFLHDRDIIERIVAAVAPQPGDALLEIGPGEGVLTLPLLRAAGALTAIELDLDLLEPLRARAAEVGTLQLLHADVLKVDLGMLAPARPLRIVGNLPYYISSPILFHCLAYATHIRDMHFMLQQEVVERMAAAPGGKDYGRLSVMLQLACTVEPLLQVSAGAFRPPPQGRIRGGAADPAGARGTAAGCACGARASRARGLRSASQDPGQRAARRA